MAWVKLDDQFADHPKIIAAGDLAGFMYVAGLCWVNKHLTDGFIPSAAIRKLSSSDDPRDLAARLVAVGLWECVEGGFEVHDYHDHNPKAEDVRALRAAERARKAAGRASQVRGQDGRVSSARIPAGQAADSASCPVNVTPVPTPHSPLPTSDSESHAHADSREEIPDSAPPREVFDFDAVYALYPKKLGRKRGLQRCASQVKTRERFDALFTAVKNYAAHVAGQDQQFVKHFDSFMSVWEDYVQPVPAARAGPRGQLPLSSSVTEESREERRKFW